MMEMPAGENVQNRVVQEGIALWNRQREAERAKKLREQKEMREMLDKYWPWGTDGPKPRGLRNLRLEGIFPDKDLQKAKRVVSPLGFGRSGGGAPVLTHSGRKAIRTREDPVLRFQWNQDLRKCVDNTLRYKADREQRELYRRQLDAQVAERKYRENQEKHDNLAFYRQSFLKSSPWGKPGPGGTIWRPPGNGWSTENTLKAMNMEPENYKDSILKDYEEFKRQSMQPLNRINKYDCSVIPWKQKPECLKFLNRASPIERSGEKRKLSPLNRKNVNGEELVTLLAKQRAVPPKIPLGTTDVTRGNPEKRNENDCPSRNKIVTISWRKPGNRDYLQQLTNQMESKQQQLKEMKLNDFEMVRRHFKALDEFWGRPGHGAPRSILRKGCLDRLLFDNTIFVH